MHRSTAGCWVGLFFSGFSLVSCSSGSEPIPISVSVSAASVVAPTADAAISTTASVAQVGLTPSFSPLIHDYVIGCAGGSNVQVTANQAIGLIESTGTAQSLTASGVGQYQHSLSLMPGQRFQFLLPGEVESYSVRCLPADFPALSVSGASQQLQVLANPQESLPQAQWYVFAPDLELTPSSPPPASYVIIADSNGTPVWWHAEPLGAANDAKVLSSNEIAWAISTQGTYVIHDFSGNLLNELTIPGNLDDHDLQPTPTGTFLGIQTVYRLCPPDCADMSPWGGSSQAGVLDAEIVEIDRESNVVWKWRTRDHIALSETGESGWFPTVGLDIIHMNAVEPDGSDGVMFSARHLNAVYHITKSTGSIDWKLGGTRRAESLTVVGDTRPTALGPTGKELSGQHDIRRWPDGSISVHDNGTIASRAPFVMRYQIDTASRTAQVVEEISQNSVTYSLCCGSARLLPGGHWVVQWGSLPFMTELTSQGESVRTINFPSSTGLFSYRSIPVVAGLVSAASLRSGMDQMFASQQGTSHN